MNWIKANAKALMALIIAILTALVVFLEGCGAPMYAVTPSPAENRLDIKRSPTGVELGVRVGANTAAGLNSATFKNKDGTEATLSGLTYSATPSDSLTAQTAAMYARAEQTSRYYTGLEQITLANWSGFNTAVGTIAPLASQYLTGLNNIRQAQLQQPTLVQQLAALISANYLSANTLTALEADPAIIAAVNRLIDARLAELAATAPAPATGPPQP
jgi:hypothetical protein